MSVKRKIKSFLFLVLNCIVFFVFSVLSTNAIVLNDAYNYSDDFTDSNGINFSETQNFINTGGTMLSTGQISTLTSNCFTLPQPVGGSLTEWSYIDIEAIDLTHTVSNSFEVRDCSNNTLISSTLAEGINGIDISSIPNTIINLKLVFQVEHAGVPGAGVTGSKINNWKVFGKSSNITGLEILPNQISIDSNSTITFNINTSSNGAITQNPILEVSLEDINGEGDTDNNGNGQIDLGLAQDATVCYDIDNDGIVETNPAQGECDFYRPLEFSSASNGPNGEVPTIPAIGDTTGTIIYNLDNLLDGYSGSISITLKIPKGYVDQKTLKANVSLTFGNVSVTGSLNNQQTLTAESQDVTVNGAENLIINFGSQFNNLGPGATHVYDYGYIRNSLGSELNGADFENTTVTLTASGGSCVAEYDGYNVNHYSGVYPYTVISEPAIGDSLNVSNPVILKFHRISFDRLQYGLFFNIPATCSDGDIEISKAVIEKEASILADIDVSHNIVTENCRGAYWITRRVMSGLEPGRDYLNWPAGNVGDGTYINQESIGPGEYFQYWLYGNGSRRTHTTKLDHTYTLTEIPPGHTFHGIRDYDWLSAVYKDSDGDALSPDDPSFTHGDPESSGWHPVEMIWPGSPFLDAFDDNNSVAVVGPGTRIMTVKNDDNPAWVSPDYGSMLASLVFRTCDGSFGCTQQVDGSTIVLNSVSSKLYTYQALVAPNVRECISNMGSWSNYLEIKSWTGLFVSSQETQFLAGSNVKLVLEPYNLNSASQYSQSAYGFNLYNIRDQIDLNGLTGQVVLPTGADTPHPDQNIVGESCDLGNIVFHPPDETACLNSTDPTGADCFAYWEIPDACQLPNGWGKYSKATIPSSYYQSTYKLELSTPILSTVAAGAVLTFEAESRTTDLSVLGADNAVDTARWSEDHYRDTTDITVLSTPALDVTQTAPSDWPFDSVFSYNVQVENLGNAPNNGLFIVTKLPKLMDSLGSTFTPDYQKVYLNLLSDDSIVEVSNDIDCFSNPLSGTWTQITTQSTLRTGFLSETVDPINPSSNCLRLRANPSGLIQIDPGQSIIGAIDIYIPATTPEGEELKSKSLAGSNNSWGGAGNLTVVETNPTSTRVGFNITLEMEKEYYPDNTQPGRVKWIINYANQSATPALNISIQDNLPNEVIFQSLEPLQVNESCIPDCLIQNPNPDGSGGILSFIISNLDANDGNPNGGSDQGTIEIWTIIKSGVAPLTTIENCATISPDGAGFGDSDCSDFTTADLTLTKDQTLFPNLGSNYVQIGESQITYTITATNNETFPVYFHFFDDLPSNTIYEPGTLKINGATASDSLLSGNLLDYTLISQTDPGSDAVVEFDLNVASGILPNLEIINQAVISYCTNPLDIQTCAPAKETNQTLARTIASNLTVLPNPLIFDPQKKDTTLTQTITLTNNDLAPVFLSSFDLSSNQEFKINQTQTICSQNQTLNQGESCQMVINFTPKEFKNYQDALTILSNDTNNPQIEVSIYGSTIYPNIQVNPNPLDFGTVPLYFRKQKTLTIRNTAQSDLTLIDIELLDNRDNSYKINQEGTTCAKNMKLSQNQTCEIVVVFMPSESISYNNGLIRIISDQPDNPQVDVLILGQGREEIQEVTITGTLFRSTHTGPHTRGFRKEKQRKVCLVTDKGAIKKCDKTNGRGKFNLRGIKPYKTYFLTSSSKKPVTRSYFFRRMNLYKQKYQPTFGDLWKKKFKSNYRIKKAKNKGYPYDVKYYRKYKGIKEVKTKANQEVDLYLR